MQQFQKRLRHAAGQSASSWVSAIALCAGALSARAIIHFAPAGGADVAAARSLGIISVSVLANHSKSAELLAYVLGLCGAIMVSVGIWVVWANWAGRNNTAPPEAVRSAPARLTAVELAIVSLLAFALFARFWNGRAATFSAWSVLDEEGEMLAWIDTVLRGGALSRDVFCLYGPLSTWPVAVLFAVFKPSLGLWRTWIFALNAPALIGVYVLLRGTTRTKLAAGAGTLICGILCTFPIPAMSWSLARVAFGLTALAVFRSALNRDARTGYLATGALMGAALLYSQEVGIACALGVFVAFLIRRRACLRESFWTVVGLALVLMPVAVYLIATNSLYATVDNLFLFPRVRMLGFGALPFPRLTLSSESMRAYFVPAVLAVSAFATATKLLRGVMSPTVLTEIALFIFGAVLFSAALSRPDDTHFAFVAPPAFVLLTGLLEEWCFAARVPEHRLAAIGAVALGMAAVAPWASPAQGNVASLIQPPTGRPLALPRGGDALFPDEFARDVEEVTREIQSRTPPGQPFWVFPNEALFYFLADRPQPTRFPLALFAVTREQREQLVSELERTRPAWAVVYQEAPAVDAIPYRVALPEVVAYLLANYRVETNVGPFALLRRND